MKTIKVIRVLVETSVGLRYAYIQQITPKSLVIIRDENTCEVFNRKTGKMRPESKFSKTKIQSLRQIEEFIASKVSLEKKFRVMQSETQVSSQEPSQISSQVSMQPEISHEISNQYSGKNSHNCYNCWHGGWLPNSDDSKVSLTSKRYFKNEHPLCQFAVVNNTLKFPDVTTGSGYDYERWFLAQGVEIIDLSK